MPHQTCIICTKRIFSSEVKRKIGSPKLWELITNLSSTWNHHIDLHPDHVLCKSCNLKVVFGKGHELPDPTSVHDEQPMESQVFDLVSSVPIDAYNQGSQEESMELDIISSVPMSVYGSQPVTISSNWDTSLEVAESSSSWIQSQIQMSSRRYEGIKSVKSTESSCFLCGKKDRRQRIPKTAIIDVWVQLQIRIPFTNRCCSEHIRCLRFTTEALALLEPRTEYSIMTDAEVVEWMQLLAQEVNARKIPFDFSNQDVSNEEYKILVGITKDNFQKLLSYCVHLRNSCNRTKSNALAMLLIKMRLNVSQNVLAILFDMKSQAAVSDSLNSVIDALTTHFVPHYLGYQHLSRQDVIDLHSVNSFNTLLHKQESMILILDGTYFYIQKPSDYEKQRQTYNPHKHRNLLKGMMVVTTTGYIMECEGPYYSDASNNDAKILRDMMNKTDHSIMNFFEAGDCALLDRGFRDVVQEIEDHEIHSMMPNLLRKPAKQFSSKEANESRQVTMGRWIVEVVNGRLKNKFHFFDSVIPASYLPKLKAMLRIACAIINAFSPPIFSASDLHDHLVQSALRRIPDPNVLQGELESTGLINRRVVWRESGPDSCPNFPKLTEEELQEITLGKYQLKMGSRYAEQHIKNDPTSTFKILVHRVEENLIKAMIQSRFSKATRHNLWIKFIPDGTGSQSIIQWFCKCKTGARTLGCCSHIAGVIWYLAYARHNLDKLPKRRNICSGILNATVALVQDDDLQNDVDSEEDF